MSAGLGPPWGRHPGGVSLVSSPTFIRGLALCEAFYREVVARILREVFPGLAYSAGRLGGGSDVLGYDTAMSMDHDWGPRLELFLSEPDDARHAGEVRAALVARLPREFRGFPVSFAMTDRAEGSSAPVRHRVTVQTVGAFLEACLGFDARRPLDPVDWLSFSEQSLLEATGGAVFHDGLGELGPLREKLTYYPRDVWLYRLGSQWRRIAQEEPFVGRCGVVGDDLGSRIVAARLVRDLMRLCLLMERRYAPYSKWLGTAFSKLECFARLRVPLNRALRAEEWPERGEALAEAYEMAGRMHNDLHLMPPLDPKTRQFFDRPFRVLFADRFADALRAEIGDAVLRELPLMGGVDQFCDSTDVTSYSARAQKLRALYEKRGLQG